MDFKNYIFNDAPSPIMGTILRGGMDDGKGSWYMVKGKGKGAHGRRPVPLGPRPQMPPTVPPRPKLMPTTIRHGGAWMQCLLWVPVQPGASPQLPPLFSCAGAPPPPPPPNTSGLPRTPVARQPRCRLVVWKQQSQKLLLLPWTKLALWKVQPMRRPMWKRTVVPKPVFLSSFF